ncbi:hypothetical protein TVAG_003630 [Trichomonas vaginalis G3]|uniref:Uncharacterized protein n=1 Tax=Trichomonas vaginalis (strain ATCC PRA-98 / G3) TaxID=412133 RepID=A2E577_TRIV3|nr:hypothetical protein TVAGG3_0475660 [Trichomonas vaginalis G3]EAY12157.1 hypothetical protein TVAG_003630 [Trichomonas vaginalis G3]KAI5515380.1 hypothetical protein TVAGG3_0475660 [Trichomonas vaginalis G3]|eukprot:XP_001324380.1 hypothetical protein [Trichomonas vaginalis G3]
MKVALNAMLERKTVDWIRETRICAFENCVRPTFLTIRANKALSDYSNTLGMFWNEIINDNTDHLISLTNQVASSYITLTGLFKQYGTAGQLSSPYNKFCQITNYNTESQNTNFAYALVSRSGNKGESSFTCSHLTQNLFVYMAICLLIINMSINLYMDLKINQMWNASIDAFKIIQSVAAGSFVSTVIQLKPSLNISQYVYSNKTFDSKLENLTGDLQIFVNEITKHLNELKAYKTEDFSQIINKWLVKQFNVTRFPSTVETALGILASSYQSVVSGNVPSYDGLYVKGSTDLIIYSQNLYDTISELSNYAIKMVHDYSRVMRIVNLSFIFIGLLLMILFAFIMLKSILSFFQPLFKLSKTDLITITKELISWVKDNHQQQEDNNIRYNRELIISKTHTNTYTNSIFRNNLIFKRFFMYLLFIIILTVYSETICSTLKGDATDIGSSLYAYLMPYQLLKIGQLFLLARKDVVYNNNVSNTRRLLEESTLESNNFMRYQCTTNSKEPDMEKFNRIVSELNLNGQRTVLADESDINETATQEMRKAHIKNLYTMIEFARKMVNTAVAKFAASNPRVMDIALYISVDISSPRDQRSLFSAIDNAALNIYDSLNKNYKNEDFRSLVVQIIKISTTYSDFCEVSIQKNLVIQRDNIMFSITMQAILSFSLILFVLAIYTTNGTFWLNYDVLTKCIISSLPKFNNSNGSLTDSISLSTREEEMKKSSAVVVDIMNSYELREDLLEHHILLNSNEIVVSCSSLIEDFLSSPPMLGRKFDDCINSIGTIIPSELTNDDSNGKATRILFRPKDEKKRDIIMEILKYKFDNLEMKEGNVSYVCVITDKTKEYEATVLWRNELNQLKLIGLQFMPSEVYDSLTGDESVTTLQINNAYVSTFYIRGIKGIDTISAVKQIVILGCKEYNHIWPVARSTIAIKLYSGLLDQNISHFRALITLLHVSLRISKNLSDINVEPHCVISKVKATHATFGIDTPPIFEMRDDNPYDLILAMGSPAHKISISREPYEILYNTGIPTEFAFYFRSEGFHKVSYDTINEVESIIEREQMQLAIV